MRSGNILRVAALAAVIGSTSQVAAQPYFERQPPPPQPVQFVHDHVSLRGPVHEAFAQPYLPNPEQGLAAGQLPPPDIRELVPIARPTHLAEAEWIPGYWGLDERGYIWVSGLWRDPPPEMRWVPGYWAQVGDAVRWAPGFWMREDESEVAYVPQPPASRDEGPIGEAPDEQHFWVPGVWVFVNGEFHWREGFWAAAHPDYVWTPAQYLWSPRGYVFVEGYWDYPPERRGQLFAPLLPTERQTVYTPSVIIEAPSVFVHYFVRPSYCHYYFGDYYGDHYVQRGFQPWLGYRSFDPLRIFFHMSRPTVYQTIVQRHRFFVSNPSWRPPHHWREHRDYARRFNDRDTFGVHLAVSLSDRLRDGRGTGFVSVPNEVRERHGQAREYFRDFSSKRRQLEQDNNDRRPGRLSFTDSTPPDRPARPPIVKREDRPPANAKDLRRLPPPPLQKSGAKDFPPDRKNFEEPRKGEPKKGFDRPDEPKNTQPSQPKEPPKKGFDRPDEPRKTEPKKDFDPKNPQPSQPKEPPKKGFDRPVEPKNTQPVQPKEPPKKAEPKKDFEQPVQPKTNQPSFPPKEPPKKAEPKREVEQPKQVPPTKFNPPSAPREQPKQVPPKFNPPSAPREQPKQVQPRQVERPAPPKFNRPPSAPQNQPRQVEPKRIERPPQPRQTPRPPDRQIQKGREAPRPSGSPPKQNRPKGKKN